MGKIDRTTWKLIAGSAVCLIAAILLGIAAWALENSPSSGPDHPKVTDWMQAWGSIGGVIAGLAAASAAALLLMFERKRADEAQRQLLEERAEAALNVARAVVVTEASFGGYGGDEDPHINSLVTKVHNFGLHPIRNVYAVVTLPTGDQHVLPPIDIVNPGGEKDLSRTYARGIPVPPPWKFHQKKEPVAVCFMDYTDQAWQRTSAGAVKRTTVPYPLVEESLSRPIEAWGE